MPCRDDYLSVRVSDRVFLGVRAKTDDNIRRR